jgi:hypothetical protein
MSENEVITVDLSQPVQSEATPEETTEETTEVETTQEPEQPKEDPKFSQRFAALSKKEKELYQKEKALKESLQKLEEFNATLSKSKEDPLVLLKAAGFNSLEDYLQAVISTDKEAPDPYKQKVDQIEKEIEAYKAAQEEQRKAYEEQVKQEQLTQIHNQINSFITEQGDKYELIQAYNAIEDVWSLIERVYIETKGETHLTIEQASDEVEKYYFDKAKEEAERVLKLKKLALKAESPKEETPKRTETKEVVKDEFDLPPTLTNASTSIPNPSTPMLSREERLKRAASKLKWNDE